VVKQHWGQLMGVVVCMVNHHPVAMPCNNTENQMQINLKVALANGK
jgi:hypothetical protein